MYCKGLHAALLALRLAHSSHAEGFELNFFKQSQPSENFLLCLEGKFNFGPGHRPGNNEHYTPSPLGQIKINFYIHGNLFQSGVLAFFFSCYEKRSKTSPATDGK
jgi:hypothetical protein